MRKWGDILLRQNHKFVYALLCAKTVCDMDQYENIELWASKQQGDWPQSSIASQITRERLEALNHVFPKGKLDNMVKVRLLLACAFLPLHQLAELRAELNALADIARTDDDEWVRVVGAAVGNLDGQLDMASVCGASALVRQTLEGLWSGLADAAPPPGYRPLQEVLMHPAARPPVPHVPAWSHVYSPHFCVRGTAEALEALAVSSPDNLLGVPGGNSGSAAGMGSDTHAPGVGFRGAAMAGRIGTSGLAEGSLFISRPPAPHTRTTFHQSADMQASSYDAQQDMVGADADGMIEDVAGVAYAEAEAEGTPHGTGVEELQPDAGLGHDAEDMQADTFEADPDFDVTRDGKRARLVGAHGSSEGADIVDAEEI